MIDCPDCDARFEVVWWLLSVDTLYGPSYCPFCGEEIDYAEADSAE